MKTVHYHCTTENDGAVPYVVLTRFFSPIGLEIIPYRTNGMSQLGEVENMRMASYGKGRSLPEVAELSRSPIVADLVFLISISITRRLGYRKIR